MGQYEQCNESLIDDDAGTTADRDIAG